MITAGPAAVRLGVDPNKVAGIQGHAGHIGNLAGFTHPTQVAILATAGIGYGLFNVLGLIAALSIFFMSCLRVILVICTSAASLFLKKTDWQSWPRLTIKSTRLLPSELSSHSLFLVVGFVLGFLPIFLVGLVSALVVMVLAHKDMKSSEQTMMQGVGLIATPLVATIGFLFMSTVIKQIGLADTISHICSPDAFLLSDFDHVLRVFRHGFHDSILRCASVAVVIPFLQVVLASGADPFAAAFAAASGASLIQYFLTGGPVAALATVIPVVPGSALKPANLFQRPSILFGCFVALCISMALSIL